MPVMLTRSVTELPTTSCHSVKIRATAMLPAAGIVVTEMKTPARPPDLGRREGEHPRRSGDDGDDQGPRVRRVDEARSGAVLGTDLIGHDQPGGTRDDGERGYDRDGTHETDDEGAQGLSHECEATPDQPESEGRNGHELRTEDHRADDEDHRVGDDGDGREQGRQDHEAHECPGDRRVVVGALGDLGPHHGVGAGTVRVLLRRKTAPRHPGGDGQQLDGALLLHAEGDKSVDDLVHRLARQIGLEHVALWNDARALVHDKAARGGIGLENRGGARREGPWTGHAHRDHAAILPPCCA